MKETLVQENPVQLLDQEDTLEKERATNSPYSCLKNPMDRGVWQATVHGIPRVGHNLVTKPPPPDFKSFTTISIMYTVVPYNINLR